MLINSVIVWDDEDDGDGTHKITITYNLTPRKSKTIMVKDLSKVGCVFQPDKPTKTLQKNFCSVFLFQY